MKVRRLLHWHRWLALVLVAIWTIGAIALYWQLPIEPKTVWPMDFTRGIGAWVNGSRYLTSGPPRVGIALTFVVDTGYDAPIRLWDTQTGQLMAEHLTENDKFDYRVMRDDRLRIMVRGDNSTQKTRCDYILNLRTGTLTPTSTQPELDELVDIHPGHEFVVCAARSPRTGLDWVDPDSGQIIRSFPDAKVGFRWTADRSHYAYQSGDSVVVCRVSDHSIVYKLTPSKAVPRIVSVSAGIVVDHEGQVWDLRSGELLWHDTTNSFRNSGVELTADESAIVWRKSTDPWEIVHLDVRTGREIPGKSFRLPTAEEGPFGGEAGAYWIACISRKSPVNQSAWQRFIEDIPLIGPQLVNDELYSTVIVDSNRLTEIFRCPGHLHCMSEDRRTVITSYGDGYAVWNVPGRPSWRTIVIIMAGWTCLWFATSCLFLGVVFLVRRNSRKRPI